MSPVGSVWSVQLGGEVFRPALIVADPGGALVTVCAMIMRPRLGVETLEVPCALGPDLYWVRCDAIHAISRGRLVEQLGTLGADVMARVRVGLGRILGLS